MPIIESMTDLVGNTPLVRLSRLSEGTGATILGKLESANPAGSVKDRIGLAMVEAAEREGLLTPGSPHPATPALRSHSCAPHAGTSASSRCPRP